MISAPFQGAVNHLIIVSVIVSPANILRSLRDCYLHK